MSTTIVSYFHIVCGLVGLWLIHAIARCLIQAHFTPLSKIPNAHPLAPYTSLWNSWVRYKGDNLWTAQKAHDKLGPVVRLGPNELSVNCIENGTKTIYGTKSFGKHHFYLTFRNFGADTMTTAFDTKQHTAQRKRPANVFTRSYVFQSADMMALMQYTLYERLQPILAAKASVNNIVNIMPLSRAVSMDLWTAFVFGLRQSTRLLDDLAGADDLYHMITESRPREKSYWIHELPRLTGLMTRLGFRWFPDSALKQSDGVDAWWLSMMDKLEEQMSQIDCGTYPPFSDGERPVVYSQYKAAITKEGISQEPTVREYTTLPKTWIRAGVVSQSVLTKPRSPVEVALASELMDSTLAMNHVYPILIIYCCYYLSRYPEVQDRLRQELKTVSRPAEQPDKWLLPDSNMLEELPLLNAVVNETLRLRGPNPGQELRITPQGRKTRLGPFEGIPGGVVVSSNSWSLHRTPEVFPDPDNWHPERWLQNSGSLKGNGEQNKWMWSFSYGPRGCIGKDVGVFWTKHILASIYTSLSSTLVDEPDMDVVGGYIVAPKAPTLNLRFTRA